MSLTFQTKLLLYQYYVPVIEYIHILWCQHTTEFTECK
jgi:hypothetical protein